MIYHPRNNANCKQLKATNDLGNNKLIFANKTKRDIILQQEFKSLEIDEPINHGSADENKREKELKKSIGRWFSDGGKNPG